MSSNRVETKKAQTSAAIKTLKDSSNAQEKCKALSCIQSAILKSGGQDVPTENQSREICKLVINAFTSGNKVLYPEAKSTLVAILRSYKDRKLNLFNELMQITFADRLKIFQLFEGLHDDTIKAVSRDASIVDFFQDCMSSITPELMNWLSPSVCTDNIKPLQIIEDKTLSPAEQVEEHITISILNLLHRFYKLSNSPSYAECAKFSTLFMDQIATLAYMGHKRQRAPAIKVLQLPNMGNHIRSTSPAIWQDYKTTLQNVYCRRMAVLVGACEPDWSLLWTASIQLLGTDLHRGAGLINNLLGVEEKAFKSVDTVVRRQAFLSWKLIVDNFALDEQELATARRVKLLCIPLNAKNSKTESMTLTKLEVWWHLINKLYKHMEKFTNPVLTQFLNFSFGPLGDTPLLSSKFNVIASPGKRFCKTKLVATDALLQLLTDNADDLKVLTSPLQEKIAAPVSSKVFEECSKPFIHSIGEACLALAQLTRAELENKVPVIATLWKTLLIRVSDVQDDTVKVQMYRDIMLLVVELSEHCDSKPIIRDAMLDIILPSLDELPPNCIFHFETIIGLMSVVTKPPILTRIIKKHHDLIKRLLWRGIKPTQALSSYVPNTLEVFRKLVTQLDSVKSDIENLKGITVLWNVLCEIITRYMTDGKNMNEGDSSSHDFMTIQILIKFPFTNSFAPEFWQYKKVAVVWKLLYKQFDAQASLVSTVKPNEYVSFAIGVIQDGIELDRRCAGFAVTCLDGILTTMNYKHVLDENGFLPIVKLINDLCIVTLTDGKTKDAEAALRELSSVLITLYGHAPNKVPSCLEAVRSAIEHMLKPCNEENLVKEIASTWETIMSIFKGLGGQLSPDVIVSFQNAIRLALHHHESEIVSQTVSCLETEEYMNGPTKDLVETFLKEVDLDDVKKRTTGAVSMRENDQKLTKVTKYYGSFLNKRTASPKTVTPNQKSKDGRKSSVFPEPESQDYVVIKSDFKFDANRLTEHQKESLLRRREDIPALYNDLSQSCSQDTQNIQEWFDKKKNELDKIATKNSSNNSNIGAASAAPTPPTNLQCIDVEDANKENNLDSSAAAGIGISDTLRNAKDKTKFKENETSNAHDKKMGTKTKEQNLASTSVDEILSPSIELEDDDPESTKSVVKKLDFESRTEFPEDGSYVPKSTEMPSTSRSSETVEENTKKQGKTKGKSEMVQDSITQETGNQREVRRGVKRKAAVTVSDSDSEGTVIPSRRQRKSVLPISMTETQSDSDSVKSAESDETTKQLSRRTKIEMSRLQINMVFDNKQFSTLPTRRRSKITHEDDAEVVSDNHDVSEISKLTRNRVSKSTAQEAPKLNVKAIDKDPKYTAGPKSFKKRGRRSKNAVQEQHRENPLQDTPLEASSSRVLSPSLKDPISTAPKDQKASKLKSKESSEPKEGKDRKEAPGSVKEVNSKDLDANETHFDQAASQSRNDSEEIVESSQASNIGSVPLDKKCNNKQCFIRINKMKRMQPGQSMELNVGNEKTKIIKGLEPDSPFKICAAEVYDGAAKTPLRDVSIDEDDPMAEMLDKEKVGPSSNLSEQFAENRSSASLPPTAPSSEVGKKEAPVIIEVNLLFASPESRQPPTDASFSPGRLSTSLLNSCSPKNSLKRYSKGKSVTTQGRAAHMLGLVTKQAIAETRPDVIIEDDILSDKKKGKEGDEENVGAKKERVFVLKEPERLGSPSGSRQEKIFNKMRITPENEIPPAVSSLFENLKNDGEKSSSRNNSEKEKNASENTGATTQTEKNREKNDAENTLPVQEREMLPMLEWSSANPPSLTASPSASILKRQRLLQIDNDPESPTACKRKRVSFADPPVSKEMGYEIPASTPAHRMSKVSSSRILLPRKDSPIRLKQTKIKLGQSSSVRSDKEPEMEIVNDTESQVTQTLSDVETERKIDDDSDSLVIIFPETQNHSPIIVNNETTDTLFQQQLLANNSAKVTLDNLAVEAEITPAAQDLKGKDKDKTKDRDVIVIKEVNAIAKSKTDETETQQDIFDNTDVDDNFKSSKNNTKKRSPKAKTFPEENSLRCVDINILTNPSIVENNLPRSQSSMEVLEDTVDIQNVTGLNSTTNSEEIFYSRPVRTSTQSTEADTLPVTDSVFASLPYSQSSQATNDSMELDQPELLDSTRSIYPPLTESSAPIDSVIKYLVDPLWNSHLSNYFHSKGIETVGNLAQLTEREVNWIPVKRSPRVPFVRNILQHFEKSLVSLPSTTSTVDTSQESGTTTPNASMSSLPPSSTPITQSSSLCAPLDQRNAGRLTNESLTRIEKETKSTETQVTIEELLEDLDPDVVLRSAIKRCPAENILTYYKLKMKNMAEEDLERQTIKMLGIEVRVPGDSQLKATCRASGVSKVLGRLPDIFSHDKEFFAKVLTTYRHKLKASDCIASLDFEEMKAAICRKCQSSDLAEMLSSKLKEEEEAGVTTPMTELSSLQAMLKRMPKDLIISHTVANEELISPLIVLDIALQNNNPADISSALEAQPSSVRNRVYADLCTTKALSTRVEQGNLSDEMLTDMLRAISKKLETPKLLDAFNTIIKEKFVQQQNPASSRNP